MPGSLLWFRKGLRVHDNPALLEAIQDTEAFFPVFCLDPWFIRSGRIGANRINFLLESLSDLDASLRDRGGRLIVLEGDPKEALPAVVDAWGVTKFCYEKDTEPYALNRDGAVCRAMSERDVKVHARVSHTLYDPDHLISRNGGKAPQSMTALQQVVKKVGSPAEARDAPDKVPACDDDMLPKAKQYLWNGTGDVPQWAHLGLEDPQDGWTPFKGGESEALKRLEAYLKRTEYICTFEKPKGDPSAFDPEPATTVLSPYLKFGCLSARRFYHELMAVYDAGRKQNISVTKPPTSLEGQLLWREFYYTVGYATPNFHQMEGNPEIRQIPWDINEQYIDKWEYGKTGYPWIDAAMNQLRSWGWMHHLARHSVACFLTRGDLYCHWERGREIFDKYLIDADYFINNGNWQWLSCSNFFYQYFRVYSPITYGKKYDANGDYIRKFVPELRDFPKKYIYEPWTAPKEVQEKAGCIIGKDYPLPIVDHKEASKQCKARMKEAYDAHRAGHPLNAGSKRKRADNDGANEGRDEEIENGDVEC